MAQVKEGMATIEVDSEVFFNPKMQGLRDLSVSFVRAVKGKNAKLLDCTAASGVRGIRYAREAKIGSVTFLDINKKAYLKAKKNVKLNGLKSIVLNKSIQEFANTSRENFDIIDLDPFGTPTPYIYDLMKLARDQTILMVTATDTAVLCGAHASACLKLYNAKPMHSEIGKEAGIRILIGYTARMASQFNFGLEPLMSVSNMHYMRIFLRLRSGAAKAVESAKNMGFGTYCTKCHNFSTTYGTAPFLLKQCDYCGKDMEPFGPIWLGMLQDKELLYKIEKEEKSESLRKMVELLKEELEVPFFYSIPKLTKFLAISSVSHRRVIEQLKKNGKEASPTQFDENGVKTNAKIRDVMELLSVKK